MNHTTVIILTIIVSALLYGGGFIYLIHPLGKKYNSALKKLGLYAMLTGFVVVTIWFLLMIIKSVIPS